MTNAAIDRMLISDDYRRMQQELHTNPNYGIASVTYAPLVADVIRVHTPRELLDYGAGKGRLGQTIASEFNVRIPVRHYDPAIPEWSQSPRPCEMVACIDVLEHIEPDCLANVLDDLQRVTARIGLFTVDTGPAMKTLADGRNAHLIQKPSSWWLPQLMERFELLVFNRVENGFWVLVEARQQRQ